MSPLGTVVSGSTTDAVRYQHTLCTRQRGRFRFVHCQSGAEQVSTSSPPQEKLLLGSPGLRQGGVHRFWQRLQAAALAKPASQVDEEISVKRIKLWPSRIVNPEERRYIATEDGWDVETADDFFRDKGPSAPGLIAASLLDVVLLKLRSEDQTQRPQLIPQKRRRGPGDQDWSAYRKYDVFQSILASSPLLKEERFSPLKALLRAAPRSRAGKYDFIRALLDSLSSQPTGSHKWDLVHELLHKGRVEAEHKASRGDSEALRKYDMVFDLLHSSRIAADWDLPTSGLAHDLLHMDEWGPREADPIGWALEHSWHGNVRYSWDPLVAAFGAAAPTARAQWDPLQAVLAAKAPVGDGWVDPLGHLLKSSKEERQADSKYNPLPSLFAAQAPPPGGSDVVGDIIRGLKSLDLRGTPDAVGDILKGLIKQDLSKTPDAVHDILKGLIRAADFTSSPNISGLTAAQHRGAKYFPQILEQTTPPRRGWHDPVGEAAKRLKAAQPFSAGKSKYDPVPAALAASPSRTAPGGGFFASLLNARASGDEKFNPVPDVLAAEARPKGAKRGDVLGKLLRADAPQGEGKYDPVPFLWRLGRRSQAEQALRDPSSQTQAVSIPGQSLEITAQPIGSPGDEKSYQTNYKESKATELQPPGASPLPLSEAEAPLSLPEAEIQPLLPEPQPKGYSERNSASQQIAPSRSNGDRPGLARPEEASGRFRGDSSAGSPGTSGGHEVRERVERQNVLLRKVQGLEARVRQLAEQSDVLRKKFGQKAQPPKQLPKPKPQPASQQRTREVSEAVELERQNAALRRQLSDAQKRKEQLLAAALDGDWRGSGQRDLMPDILRLQGALLAGPVAGYDPLAVFERRGGSKEFQAVAAAFRELRLDSQFAEKHSPLYRLMLGSGADITNSNRDVSEAEGTSRSFLEDLEGRRNYGPLSELLGGRPPQAVVGAICALGALTKQ